MEPKNGREAFKLAVNSDRYNYFEVSTPVLQWLLKVTSVQMKNCGRERYREARVTHEAVKKEIEFRNYILRVEMHLEEQWRTE